MKRVLNIFLFLVYYAFVNSAYSQESMLIPDSIWETPQMLALFGKEQAASGNLDVIEAVENDNRFKELSIEATFHFFDQTQLGFFKILDYENAKKYKLKAIHFAKKNNREDLNFSGSTEGASIQHSYYWVSCYEVYKEQLDSAVYYSLLNLSEIEKQYGLESTEFLRALLSPSLFSRSSNYVTDLDFGTPRKGKTDSIKPKLIEGHFDNYHDAMLSINNALNTYQYSDSSLNAELLWHKGDLLFNNGNIEEGLSLMYKSIAMSNKVGLCLTDKFEGGLFKILCVANCLMKYGDYFTCFLVNKYLLEAASDKMDNETIISVKSNIVSTATRMWLFDYADKYLTELEESKCDKYRVVQNKYYRGLYYFELSKKENSIEPLYKAIPYYEDIIKNSWHKERVTTYQQLMEIYNIVGSNTDDFSKLENLQERMLNLEADKILDRLCNSTINQQYDPFYDMGYLYSVVNPKTTEQFFEHILFKWSIVTEFSMAVEKIALKDRSLSDKWKKIQELKHKNEDAELIDMLEHDLMTNINQKKLKQYLRVDFSKIKKQIDNEDVLIMLMRDDFDSIYALCLSKTEPAKKILMSEIPATELLTQPVSKIANEISQHLCPYLKKYTNVYLLLANSFSKIPLEISIVSTNKNINVHRVFSFREIKAKEGQIKDVVAFGNPNFNGTGAVSNERGFFYSPLPGTAIELDSISKIMSQKSDAMHVTSFIRDDATEENFKSLENSVVNLLHFATHAFLGEQRTFDDSGILLSEANIELNTDSLIQRFSNDGILRASG